MNFSLPQKRLKSKYVQKMEFVQRFPKQAGEIYDSCSWILSAYSHAHITLRKIDGTSIVFTKYTYQVKTKEEKLLVIRCFGI